MVEIDSTALLQSSPASAGTELIEPDTAIEQPGLPSCRLAYNAKCRVLSRVRAFLRVPKMCKAASTAEGSHNAFTTQTP